MTVRLLLLLGAGLALAACEPEKGTGFTGIGPAASQSVPGGYALDFPGLAPQSRRAVGSDGR